MSALRKITFGTDLPGYEIGSKTAPGVVVIQEWWGVTDIIKEQAEMISKRGFRCLIPDLYKGKIGVDAEEASHVLQQLMGHLDFKAATGELKQAVDYLKSTGSPKVAAVGFCMGGALSFCAAQHAGVDCAAPFYGIPGQEVCQPEKITVPVQLHFGQLDSYKGFADPETVQAVAAKMKAAGCDVELFMYPNSGHGFFNSLNEPGLAKMKEVQFPIPPREEAEEALERLVAFFNKHLH